MKHERIFLDTGDKRVYIDTYVPSLAPALRPAILVIPGGGYSQVCTDREGEPIALAFVARGYVAFVLNYRVGGAEDVFPKQLIDASRAMQYIRRHAQEYAVDPGRVYATGFSAGGHLCGSLATMFDEPAVVSALGIRDRENRPTAVALAYPVTTLHGDTHIGSFRFLLGRQEGGFTEEEAHRFSLEDRVTAETSPMYLWHTATDQLVPAVGTLRLADALIRAHIPMQMDMFPYGPHGLALANGMTACAPLAPDDAVQSAAEEWVDVAVAFFRTLPRA